MPTLTDRMVRVTIEAMDEPKDRVVLQREVAHHVMVGEITGGYLGSYAMVDGRRFDFDMSPEEEDRYFRKSAEV